MEGETEQGVTSGTDGRSADEPTPAETCAAGAAEIEDGATVDAISAGIRSTEFPRAYPRDGEGSGSADDRFAARIEGLVDLQREVGAQAAEWAQRQEPGTEDRTARLAVESVRTVLLLKIAELTEREEPPSPDEVACLALALHRIEVANRMRVAREQAAADTPLPRLPNASLPRRRN